MPSHSQSEDPLRYLPFTSQIDLNFWHKLSTKKLNELKLSEEPVKFRAEYDINHNIPRAIASIGYNALREVREFKSMFRNDWVLCRTLKS